MVARFPYDRRMRMSALNAKQSPQGNEIQPAPRSPLPGIATQPLFEIIFVLPTLFPVLAIGTCRFKVLNLKLADLLWDDGVLFIA